MKVVNEGHLKKKRKSRRLVASDLDARQDKIAQFVMGCPDGVSQEAVTAFLVEEGLLTAGCSAFGALNATCARGLIRFDLVSGLYRGW